MSQSKARVRRLITPLPLSGSIPLGHFESFSSSLKKWVAAPTRDFSSITSLGYPGLKAQAMWDSTHPGPPFESGGPMRSIKISCCEPFEVPCAVGTYYHPNGTNRYVGGFDIPSRGEFGLAPSGNVYFPFGDQLIFNNGSFSATGLSEWGSKAWSSTAPKLEKASGYVFAAEFRDVPRMLKTTSRLFHDIWKSLGGHLKSKTMTPKGAADQFLNHQFGWRPFTKDVSGFYNTITDIDNIIKRLQDENGQWIRNRATLKVEETSTKVGGGIGMFLFPSTTFQSGGWFGAASPTYEIWDETSTHITSVGMFRYYRPEFDRSQDGGYIDSIRKLQRQLTVYGVRISPSNIYKATPWTWAADWISDTGRYVDRVNDMLIDSVAAKYLYVTSRKVTQRRYVATLPFPSGTLTAEFVVGLKTTQREGALSPYGLNLSLSNLSARQLAIAGALGLTRFF